MANSNKKSSTSHDPSTDTDELDSVKDHSDAIENELLLCSNASTKHRG
jgi:hypothetical protein